MWVDGSGRFEDLGVMPVHEGQGRSRAPRLGLGEGPAGQGMDASVHRGARPDEPLADLYGRASVSPRTPRSNST
jgi:hypothetical protein